MIIDVNGKKIAFGLSWKRLVGGGTAESMAVQRAKEHKSALIWSDDEALQVGLLPPTDLTEKDAAALNTPVYAAAKILSRIPGLKKNVLLILASPKKGGSFILVALYKGKLRDKFDLVDISGETLELKLAEYRELVMSEPFDMIGDARAIEGLYPTPISVLADHADDFAALRRPKAQVPLKKVGIAIGIIMACFLLAKVGVPVATKKWHERHQKDQPNPQTVYDDAIQQLRSAPTLQATDLRPWYQWFRALPWDIGGWELNSTTCSFTPSAVMVCALNYKRALTQATNKTFLAALPLQWQRSVVLDHDVVHVQTTAPIGRVQQLSKFMDRAPAAKDVTVNFGSLLQSYEVVGKFAISPFSLFGGDGVDPNALANPYRAGNWTMDGPVRNFELLSQFPSYAIVSSINVQVTSDPQSAIDNSMFKATVKGQVLVRG